MFVANMVNMVNNIRPRAFGQHTGDRKLNGGHELSTLALQRKLSERVNHSKSQTCAARLSFMFGRENQVCRRVYTLLVGLNGFSKQKFWHRRTKPNGRAKDKGT